jgi:hypothetical protein
MKQGKSITEINSLIEKIEKVLEHECEIGARDRNTLRALLKQGNEHKKITFFVCRREDSNEIITHFTKTKGIAKSKFSLNTQPFIFVLTSQPTEPAAD